MQYLFCVGNILLSSFFATDFVHKLFVRERWSAGR